MTTSALRLLFLQILIDSYGVNEPYVRLFLLFFQFGDDWLPEAIAKGIDGFDKLGILRIVLDFVAKALDVDVDRVVHLLTVFLTFSL